MRRQLLSLACGVKRAPRAPASVPLTAPRFCYRLPQRSFSSALASSPLLSPQSSTIEPTAPAPANSALPTPSSAYPSIRKPQRLWTPDYVSPSKHIMNYLTQHGPQTRRTLYAIFGPTPTTTPATSTSPAAPSSLTSASTAAAEAIAVSPVVQSHPSCLRSKTHLTTLLQQLTRTGRVLTKRAPLTATTTATGAPTSRKASALFVYEMRNYETSWNKIRHEKEKGQKQRKKQERLQAKAKEEEERAATKERRRLRLEAGMTTSN